MKTSHTRKTIKAYNKNAEKYAEKFTHYETYINKMSEFQSKYIAHGANILDLGCGPGNNIKTILEQNASCNFIGVDLSEQFIKIAGNKYPQFAFIQEDIRKIDLKAKYDVVLASFCIVHLSNKETEELLTKISDLLKDDGYLYLSYMNGERQGFETTSFSNEEIFFNYYQDQYIIEILKLNNLRAVEISKEEYVEANGSITSDTFIYAKRI
ncbi:SAM-dependent methyltransferase [Desulfosarcina ovata subsp. sediminis]|uniref:SAM-dependent methyltransferase n=1 Tax=Desulfosarcina ovata subsp. sediminis TaxID=885957 RepID=A0A5K8A0T0_9BACT|nr:class I SAM-dependent methyltransferase [Desulfosarcina ovata]BBO86185.1 SAM-dependent methyltransferase [Desulfosarcina ovata subsp. sediminis]